MKWDAPPRLLVYLQGVEREVEGSLLDGTGEGGRALCTAAQATCAERPPQA